MNDKGNERIEKKSREVTSMKSKTKKNNVMHERIVLYPLTKATPN
jgi:hypothetical protein